jgi:hypothetical protein
MGGALSVFTAPQKLTPEIAKEMGIPWTPTAMPAVITTPSVPALQPLQPINWKKWAIIGGLVVGGLVLVDRAMTKPRVIYQPTQSIMPAAPAGHGGLGALIPPAAAGILGWLLVSKLLRTEVAGWTKASKDFFKEWAG